MKKWIIGFFCIVFLAAVIGYVVIKPHGGFDITFKNQTDQQISGLYVTYHNISSDIKVPTIMPHDQFKLNVNPSEEFGENVMELYYKDQQGNLHTETIFGYFEKGYYGDAVITVKSIDEEGNMKIEVVEDMF